MAGLMARYRHAQGLMEATFDQMDMDWEGYTDALTRNTNGVDDPAELLIILTRRCISDGAKAVEAELWADFHDAVHAYREQLDGAIVWHGTEPENWAGMDLRKGEIR
tara:strand:- start:1553 stop:1873 length:321 start_codon:yes stop_codon:yes gene_type:complete